MFLKLDHYKLDVFKVTKAMVLACYRQTVYFPNEERYGMIRQVRRAAVSALLNLSEGCSRRSIQERNRFFEISRGSVVEVDTAFDVAADLNYTFSTEPTDLGDLIIRSFQVISKMIKND
jgi:four helix bundle protein